MKLIEVGVWVCGCVYLFYSAWGSIENEIFIRALLLCLIMSLWPTKTNPIQHNTTQASTEFSYSYKIQAYTAVAFRSIFSLKSFQPNENFKYSLVLLVWIDSYCFKFFLYKY